MDSRTNSEQFSIQQPTNQPNKQTNKKLITGGNLRPNPSRRPLVPYCHSTAS